MASRADGLDAQLMLGRVAEVMVVLVTAIAIALVAAVDARKIVRTRQESRPDAMVDSAPRLFLVAIASQREEVPEEADPSSRSVAGARRSVARVSTCWVQSISSGRVDIERRARM